MTTKREIHRHEVSGLTDAIASAEGALRQQDAAATHPLTNEAFDVLVRSISSYARDLIDISLRVAVRGDADNVSAKHVERAATSLSVSTSQQRRQHVGTLGGILLGAGLSSLVSMIHSGDVSLPIVVLTCVLIGVGGAMVAAHMGRS